MKRLGFFAISILILIGVYTASPVYALTQDQFNSERDSLYSNNIYTAIQPTGYESTFKSQLYNSAAQIYPTLSPDATGAVARVSIASTWVDNIQAIIDSKRYPINVTQALQVAKNNIAAARDQATITLGQQNGTLTQDQANAQRQSVANAQNQANASAMGSNKDTGSTCKLLPIPTLGNCINEAVAWFIRNTILRIAGVLLWLAAQLLNYSINLGILQFKSWAPDTLYPIWIVVRQLISLMVVFAGLWLGFMYIVGRQDTFARYIGWLVIFALFVNFSYPVSRALIDVSNIVSLNVYTSATGPEVLSGNTNNSAGTLIMNRLGLNGLVAQAEQVDTNSSLTDVNSTPNVLVAVIFVIYAAYIFFVATGIMVARTAVLVFLTVASPLLLIDSVIPKLGDAAMKMRKLYFEQLIVAPVFMILFALTLKFTEIFSNSGALKSTNSLAGSDTVSTFFNIIMMLVMLHIMIKVTRNISGQVGDFATNALGKVGGFGIAAATGGAGLLARGSVGAAAARFRDSDWLKNSQDSRLGRGLYGLSNSLAQSTFDARNIGLVNRGASMAGLTGMGGLSMQQGIKQNYDQRFKSQEDQVRQKLGYIGSAKEQKIGVRDRYLEQITNTPTERAQRAVLKGVGKVMPMEGKDLENFRRNDAEVIRDKFDAERKKIKDRYDSFKDEDKKRDFLESQSADMKAYLTGQTPLQTGASENVAQAPTENVELAGTGAASGPRPEEVPAFIRKQQAQEAQQMNPQIPENVLKERQEAIQAAEGKAAETSTESAVDSTQIPAYQRKQATEATPRQLTPEEIQNMEKFNVRLNSAVELARTRGRRSESANQTPYGPGQTQPGAAQAAA